ncbi:hypothetical protein [Tautonia plasticadhaerens]|uniref:Uncharacterized protein n=1 Tax=Tautonia plasticadhaerens TaxID=2527974 RepID=A0A518HCI6_9BACT|nr:hypothetical protein [Tautonia plasticadhaerens]QDV38550.1 hypothetical protein ElP_65050 [Tautonia plasticadhaerens]
MASTRFRRARFGARPALRPGVEPLDGRVLLSVGLGPLPRPDPGPPVAAVGDSTAFTPPIGSDKGSITAPGLPRLGEEPIDYPGH